MSTIKGLIVGVSDYSYIKHSNLPFCRNDIALMKKALTSGLRAVDKELITCGENAVVNYNEFITALKKIVQISTLDDTLILYFSGHGTTQSADHYLVLSDSLVSTKEIIKIIETTVAKNKIIIIDSCMSGNFSIDGTASFNIGETVCEFAGKGYAVFASSNAVQYSFGHPDKPVSLYTYFLSEAIMDKHIIKRGKKSLFDINKLTSLYMDIWNKRNPAKIQSPIFRANMGGTIFFDVEDYVPYYTEKVIEETSKYIIYDVAPSHTGLAKRYKVFVILKEPCSFKEIAEIVNEIKEKAKKFEVYKNEIAKSHWRYKNPNIVWCYFGRDESDMINSNFICHCTWVDNNQDKEWWYRLDKHSFMQDGIHINVHSYYDCMKKYTLENTGAKNEVIQQTNDIMCKMITLAEQIISLYNEFKNGIFSENDLISRIKPLIPLVSECYFIQGDLPIAPDEIKEWSDAYGVLAGTIHDFILFYNEKYITQRTPENRKACMDMTIQTYYSDLEKIKELEKF